MKKHLGWAIRMLIAAAGVAYILYTLNWTSQIILPDGSRVAVAHVDLQWVTLAEDADYPAEFARADGRVARSRLATGDPELPGFEPSVAVVVREAQRPLFLAGLAVFVPVFVVGSLRWALLMRARGIQVGFGRAYRLTMAGQFFNLCMPGTTGGDVMKAYYATKGTDKRADAVVSVAVDRVCGLVGLVLLVGIIGLFSLDDPLIRRLTLAMWSGLIVLASLATVYASRKVRSMLGLGRLVGKLPGGGLVFKIDELVTAYREHKGVLLVAILMSMPMHLALITAMAMAGYALGVSQPTLYMFGTIPIVLILWSLPISGPLGLGPLDYVAMHLIVGQSETTAQQAVMMFVAYRLYAVVLGLCGSFAMFGSNAPSTKEPDVQPDASAAE